MTSLVIFLMQLSKYELGLNFKFLRSLLTKINPTKIDFIQKKVCTVNFTKATTFSTVLLCVGKLLELNYLLIFGHKNEFKILK